MGTIAILLLILVGIYTLFFTKKKRVIEKVKKDGMTLKNLEYQFQDSYDVVKHAIKNDGDALQFASIRLRRDKELVSLALSNRSSAIKYLDINIKNDSDFLIELLKGYPDSFIYIAQEVSRNLELLSKIEKNVPSLKTKVTPLIENLLLEKERENAVKAIIDNPMNLEKYTKFENDREIVLMAVKKNGESLKFASFKLRDDLEVVKEAVLSNSLAFAYASTRLRGNKEIALSAIRKSEKAFRYINSELLKEDAFLYNLISSDPLSSRYSEEEFQKDLDYLKKLQRESNSFKELNEFIHKLESRIMAEKEKNQEKESIEEKKQKRIRDLEIIKDKGQLEKILLNYSEDKEFILEALKSNGLLLQYVSKKFRGELEVVKTALRNCGLALKWCEDNLKNNEEIVFMAIAQNGLALEYASEEIRDRNEIVEYALKKAGGAFKFASSRIKKDKNFILKNLKYISSIDEFLNDEMLQDKEFLKVLRDNYIDSNYKLDALLQKYNYDVALRAVSSDGLQLEKYPEYQSNKEIVKGALSQNGLALKFVWSNLRNDKEIIKIALKSNKESIEYIGEEFKKNSTNIIEILKEQPEIFNILDKYYTEDIEFLQKVKDLIPILSPAANEKISSIKVKKERDEIEEDGLKLEKYNYYSDISLIVEAAVKENGLALEFASERLKNDKTIVEIAVLRDPHAFKFASDTLKCDQDFIISLLTKSEEILDYIDESLLNNIKFIEKILIVKPSLDNHFRNHFCRLKQIQSLIKVKNNGLLLGNLVEESDNIKIVNEAVKENGLALEFASPRLKSNKEVVTNAINENIEAMKFVNDQLKNDWAFILELYIKNRNILKFVNEGLLEDLDFLELLKKEDIKRSGEISEEINNLIRKANYKLLISNKLSLEQVSEYKDDEEIVSKLVAVYGEALHFASKRLQGNSLIVKTAVIKCPHAISYASEKLKTNRSFILEILALEPRAIYFLDSTLKSDLEFLEEALHHVFTLDIDFDEVLEYIKLLIKNLEIEGNREEEKSNNSISAKKEALENVERDCFNYTYLSDELKSDYEIAIAAMKGNIGLFNEFHKKLKNNPIIAEIALSISNEAVNYLEDEILKDRSFILENIFKYPGILDKAQDEIKNDKDFLNEIIKKASGKYEIVKEKCESLLVDDEDDYYKEVKKILREDGLKLRDYKNLNNEIDIVKVALENNGFALNFSSNKIKNNKEMVRFAMKTTPNALKYASTNLKEDKIFIMELLKENVEIFHCIGEELKHDNKYIIEILQEGIDILGYIPLDLISNVFFLYQLKNIPKVDQKKLQSYINYYEGIALTKSYGQNKSETFDKTNI